MSDGPFIVIDFETGGLDPSLHDPVQIAAIVLDRDTLEPIGKFVSYMRPDPDRVTEAALKINNLSLDALANAPSPEVVLHMFSEFLAPFGKGLFVAHNAKFDYDFLVEWAKRYGNGKFNVNRFFDYRIICTVQLAFQKYVLWDRKLSKVRLTELTQFLDIPHSAHDAASDALATCEVLRRCLHRPLWHRGLRGVRLALQQRNLKALASSLRQVY